ncbi:MAG: hypothetical protein RSA70_05695 [Clostridia bacterium]
MKFRTLREKFAQVKHKALLASVPVGVVLATAVPAFAAVGDVTPSFDLTTLMSGAMSKIVGDMLTMIASVLPTAVTLIGAGIGIAYAIKFIKKITHA